MNDFLKITNKLQTRWLTSFIELVILNKYTQHSAAAAAMVYKRWFICWLYTASFRKALDQQPTELGNRLSEVMQHDDVSNSLIRLLAPQHRLERILNLYAPHVTFIPLRQHQWCVVYLVCNTDATKTDVDTTDDDWYNPLKRINVGNRQYVKHHLAHAWLRCD